MDIKQKRQKLIEFDCDRETNGSGCGGCKFEGNVFCNKYNEYTAPDDVIEKWYDLFFGSVEKNENTCVCCGVSIPEGRQICQTCELGRQVDELEDELASTYDKLESAKAEVARKIFEEIDRIIFGHIIPNDCAIISLVKLAELKRKYEVNEE